MAAGQSELQQTLATAGEPAVEFAALSRSEQREVFFQLPDTVRQSLVADMDDEQLRAFVRRLDPDEGTDVLG
jgi:magnesium transporter